MPLFWDFSHLGIDDRSLIVNSEITNFCENCRKKWLFGYSE